MYLYVKRRRAFPAVLKTKAYFILGSPTSPFVKRWIPLTFCDMFVYRYCSQRSLRKISQAYIYSESSFRILISRSACVKIILTLLFLYFLHLCFLMIGVRSFQKKNFDILEIGNETIVEQYH